MQRISKTSAAKSPSHANPHNVLPIAAELYIDLLKRALTNTIFKTEPDVNKDTLRYTNDAITHYQQSAAVSMLPLARMENLQLCITEVIKQGVPGDFIETGIWRGGATIFMRALLRMFDVTDRVIWAADSFEGLPEPDPVKYPIEAKSFHSAAMTKYQKRFEVGLDEVKRNFEAYGMLDNQVKFLKGWFKDTLPSAPIQQLAIMRLDGDYYESTRDALINLYRKLSIGGYAIIDDYGEESWTYCRKAVDEFRQEHGINDPLVMVDQRCAFWRKTQ